MSRVVRVLPDVAAIDKTFDYIVPDALDARAAVGSMVRIDLHGRRVGGWIVATDVSPPSGVRLRELAKISGLGPPADLIELARWASWRWAGRVNALLGSASPERVVAALPAAPRAAVAEPAASTAAQMAREAIANGGGVLQLPPAADVEPVVRCAAAHGPALVVCPSVGVAGALAARLRRSGAVVARHPHDWALGAAGATVIGARGSVWAPVGGLAAIVVIDEHDESLQQEQAPTWHARDVAIERARRARVPCILVSPCPTLEARAWRTPLTLSRRDEREGWAILDVVDRRSADPREGLLSPQLVRLLQQRDRRVVCVLNRTGRAKLLACSACGELARCERCDAAVTQPDPAMLECVRCGETRPPLCLACGATRLKVLRSGVSRVRDELEALVGEPVGEITATSTAGKSMPDTRVVVGTEAVLHAVDRADAVVFLDFDQELLAPRYRAAEQALGLLVRAARVVGGRASGGRVLVQTRIPKHEAIEAALHGDPARLAANEDTRRAELGFPPHTALAVISGAAAPAFIEAFGSPLGVEILGPRDGTWLLKATDHQTLCDALAATQRPSGRVRVEVDPLRV